jgi:hypothetical protein
MNTKDGKKNPRVIHREYKDSEGNLYTEYKDSEGNIHTEYREPQKNATSYNNGFVEGNLVKEQSEDLQESHTDKNVSKGLLIGVIVTCVVGLTAGTIYFLTQQNNPEPAPVVIMPTSETNPKATESPPPVKVVEKPVVKIVEVPVPQDQPDTATVNITTNPPAATPDAKPAPVAATPDAKPAPVAATPIAKPAPVAATPTSPNDSVATPIPIKTDRDLKAEILKQFKDNLPNNQLIVEVKNSAVTVSGTVTTLEQLQQIQPLLKSIEGIDKVDLKATVPSTMQ